MCHLEGQGVNPSGSQIAPNACIKCKSSAVSKSSRIGQLTGGEEEPPFNRMREGHPSKRDHKQSMGGTPFDMTFHLSSEKFPQFYSADNSVTVITSSFLLWNLHDVTKTEAP